MKNPSDLAPTSAARERAARIAREARESCERIADAHLATAHETLAATAPDYHASVIVQSSWSAADIVAERLRAEGWIAYATVTWVWIDLPATRRARALPPWLRKVYEVWYYHPLETCFTASVLGLVVAGALPLVNA